MLYGKRPFRNTKMSKHEKLIFDEAIVVSKPCVKLLKWMIDHKGDQLKKYTSKKLLKLTKAHAWFQSEGSSFDDVLKQAQDAAQNATEALPAVVDQHQVE